MRAVAAHCWGAHAPRVLVGAPRADELCPYIHGVSYTRTIGENRFGEAPKHAREVRALPG